jgi:hypothetical protein
MKNKVDSTLGIDANFIQINSCTNIDPIKCIGPSLYGFKDDGSFTQWLVENPYKEDEATIHFIEAIELLDLDDDYPDLATLVDDISLEDVYGLEIDDTQIEDLRHHHEGGNYTTITIAFSTNIRWFPSRSRCFHLPIRPEQLVPWPY